LWRMLANFQISISANFARWLAGIVARVDDDRIRCILADQLNDELGRGTFERAHVQLFARMMEGLAPFGRSVAGDPAVLAAGRASCLAWPRSTGLPMSSRRSVRSSPARSSASRSISCWATSFAARR